MSIDSISIYIGPKHEFFMHYKSKYIFPNSKDTIENKNSYLRLNTLLYKIDD